MFFEKALCSELVVTTKVPIIFRSITAEQKRAGVDFNCSNGN